MNNNGNVGEPPKTNPAQKVPQADPSSTHSDQETKLMPPPDNRLPRYKANSGAN